ncbi:MAG: CxxxxCH/CxxCH domain-containing protein [Desulfuromonadaceae bacterium]|nr:CxxxxCH/CxxCH domain-containing protein [Desulfuromonadaceae bacterium]
MSHIKLSHLFITSTLALVLGGCGDKNDKAVFSPEGGHPSDWIITHKTSARADVASCTECHGEKYTGGIAKVGCMEPSAVKGFTCHFSSPVENMTGCISCHGNGPYGPYGVTAPNRQFAHARHTALAGVDCDTCHEKAGTGTAGHAKATGTGVSRATVVLASKYNAYKASVPFGYADGKCSNVSCHGGTLTPAWTGTLVVVSGDKNICLKCHEQRGTSGIQPYNSYYSGDYSGTNLHEYHLGAAVNATCTDCHRISTLTNYQQHYGGISANTFTAPQQTIGESPTKIGSYSSGRCLNTAVGCHPSGFNPSWR